MTPTDESARDSSRLRANYERDGFVVVRRALDVADLEACRDEYERAVRRPEDDLDPSDGAEPRVVFWRHVVGTKRRDRTLRRMPAVARLVTGAPLIRWVRALAGDATLRLFEVAVFDKPPREGGAFSWHQDISYYPFTPMNQISIWMPLDVCTLETGALRLAAGSHRSDERAAIDLHTGLALPGDQRATYEDPAALGFEVHNAEVTPGDLIAFHVRTWHQSPANVHPSAPRRGLTVRFLVGDTLFTPRPGNAAGFIASITQREGERIEGPSFPVVPESGG